MNDISPKSVAIISGGLGDIGSAVARELAARFGAAVSLGDLRPESEARFLLGELRRGGTQALYTQLDIADADAAARWVSATEAFFGVPADLIVPNAAQVTQKSIRDISPLEWERELSVNLSGSFYLAQAASARLLAAGLPGRIVFVGSWAAEAVHNGLPTYCVSKAGLRMLMRCLALDLAPDGIFVNEVAPGFVDAGLSRQVFDENPRRREAATAQIPNRRLISAAQVARQVAHLCNPETTHCIGSTLLMDGGLSLITPGYSHAD